MNFCHYLFVFSDGENKNPVHHTIDVFHMESYISGVFFFSNISKFVRAFVWIFKYVINDSIVDKHTKN